MNTADMRKELLTPVCFTKSGFEVFTLYMPEVPRKGEEVETPKGDTLIVENVRWTFSKDGSMVEYAFVTLKEK